MTSPATHRDERGAVAVMVAIAAVLLFASAAYAIDAGNGWRTRRHIVTGADAAALAAAAQYAAGQDGCADAAPDYLAANVSGAELEACLVDVRSSRAGFVAVEGSSVAKYTFAGILGIDDTTVRASTAAEWGLPRGVVGLRPFGLCIARTQEPPSELRQWLNLPNGPDGPSAVITIPYERTSGETCGGAPGNWGVLDLDGGGGGANETKDWTINGFDGSVTINQFDADADPCVPDEKIAPQTGSPSQAEAALAQLRDSGSYVAWPLYECRDGNGDNADYVIVAVAYGRLVDFNMTSQPASRFLSIQFDIGVVSGTCCSDSGIDTGARAVRICDVEPANLNNPENCT